MPIAVKVALPMQTSKTVTCKAMQIEVRDTHQPARGAVVIFLLLCQDILDRSWLVELGDRRLLDHCVLSCPALSRRLQERCKARFLRGMKGASAKR